jgi:hypothetical protein
MTEEICSMPAVFEAVRIKAPEAGGLRERDVGDIVTPAGRLLALIETALLKPFCALT